MTDLSPLHEALNDLERAAAGIAEKVAGTVTTEVDSVSQNEVDQLVSRVEGVAERLLGISAPATATATTPAASEPAAAAAAAPAAGVPEWTPDHPAS